jgi:hypothetical protein
MPEAAVAAARARPSGSTAAPWLATGPTAAWLFLRALGVVYAAAFASLAVQVEGLLGSRGILPAAPFLDAVSRAEPPPACWLEAPTLLWASGASDGALLALAWGGAALAALIVVDVAPGPLLLAAWAGYLSLVTVGRDFLAFQWDSLLLETGLAAALLAPWRIAPRLPAALGGAPARADPPPPLAASAALRLVLWKLVFMAGVVKLASGDPSWRGLTALDVHFETQPLPSWTSWYAHSLPHPLLAAGVAATLALEVAAPFLAFGPPLARRLGFLLLVGLQSLIAATGNYGFFNLLSAALCLPLLDEPLLLRLTSPLRRRPIPFPAPAPAPAPSAPPLPLRLLSALHLSLLLALLPLHLASALRAPSLARSLTPAPLLALHRGLAPLRSWNGYGLFAVMTTERLEIVVEGSDDGETWRPYVFRWKPQDPARAPRFAPLHMPRLDWQMWFAALGDARRSPWFFALCGRLLEGSPPVLALLAEDPFGGRPPRHVQALLYDYRFTRGEEGRRTGRWWRVEPRGHFVPPVALREGAR